MASLRGEPGETEKRYGPLTSNWIHFSSLLGNETRSEVGHEVYADEYSDEMPPRSGDRVYYVT